MVGRVEVSACEEAGETGGVGEEGEDGMKYDSDMWDEAALGRLTFCIIGWLDVDTLFRVLMFLVLVLQRASGSRRYSIFIAT